MNHIEAMKLALDALSKLKPRDIRDAQLQGQAWDALHQAIKQAEKQEPNVYGDGTVYRGVRSKDSQIRTLYAAPPRKEWVGLTDEDWRKEKHNTDFIAGVVWAEATLKGKNHVS